MTVRLFSVGLGEKIVPQTLIETGCSIPKLCREYCFQYDPRRRGCSYTRTDFIGIEEVEPGQPCLHPEFDEDAEVMAVSAMSLCDWLTSNYSPKKP